MKLFECDHCGQVVYFENIKCERCGHALGFAPDRLDLCALWKSSDGAMHALSGAKQAYRYCANAEHGVCNWLVPADSADDLCTACRLNRTIPDLSPPGNAALWRKMELAKHRLVYGLLKLGLTVVSKREDEAGGLAFDFLSGDGGEKVLTGHEHGLITLNLAEADDVERERARRSMHEPYRTVLGHFRHEIGHYYWEMLVEGGPWHERYRETFGDESLDYAAALQTHYANGPASGWEETHITSYATSHPWEDFAETWAHYLHMIDTLETASAFGMRIDPVIGKKADNRIQYDFAARPGRDFSELVESWVPLTAALNSLNKSMGQRDLYPFVLTPAVIGKLEFIHELIADSVQST